MKMNKSIIFIFMFALLISSVYAQEHNVTLDLNESSFVIASINLSSLENQSMFIEKIYDGSELAIVFNDVVNFTNSTVQTVEFNISKNKVFLHNESIDVLFSLTNDFNNAQLNHTITVNVIPSDDVVFTDDSFLELNEGNYVLNISETLLNTKGKGDLEYKISGVEGSTLLIDCSVSDWLTCPSQVIFDSNNESIFNVSYFIPLTANVGDYDFKIVLKTSNISLDTYFNVYIEEPNILFEDYQLSDDCIADFNGSQYVDFNCFVLYEEHNVHRLSQVYELWRERVQSCEATVVNQTVMVGNIDDELYFLLEVCEEDRDGFKADYHEAISNTVSCQNDYDSLSNSYDDIQNKLLDNESATLTQAFNYKASALSECADSINQTNHINNQKIKTSRWINFAIWFATVFVVITILVLRYKKNELKFKW